jgi:hypothetical protein
MKQLLKKIKQISMLLLVISLIGCENDDTLLPEVISSFTHTINADTGTVTFINTSVNSKNYFWTFGDGTSSTEINPIKTYTTGEYKVTLKVTNVAGASDTSEDIIVISDAGAPVITLLGDATINIMVGGTFTEPGATATDDVDGDITTNIVFGGDTVDESTAGTYIITYNVSDAAGNAATQRTRTVIVAADIVKPVITLTGSATINMMVGDPFTDEGATATDDLDGDITADIVVGGDTVDVNTAATYTITYNVSDAAGNAADEVTRTVIVAAVPGPSGAYLYSTAGIVDIVTVWSDWSTGTIQDGAYALDPTYNPCIKLSGGSWGALVAFTEMPTGTLAEYGNLELKIKSDEATFKVKVPEEEREFNIADGTPLEGGWVQMSIPLSTFGAAVDTAVELAIWGPGGTTLYLTDIMLSGDGGVVPPSDCPAPPAGELLSNGDFEAGGGTSELSTEEATSGTNSAKLITGANQVPNIKMERFASSLAAGVTVQVSFKYKFTTALGTGSILQVLAFSEKIEGAVEHNLGNATDMPLDTWNTFTGTFITPAEIADGISLLLQLTGSGNAAGAGVVYIDDVQVTQL